MMAGFSAPLIPCLGRPLCWRKARALGQLVKSGWAPKRTIIYASWDGEEPGMLGSTEWAETHADELRKKGFIYINSDEISRGILDVGGSEDLEKFRRSVNRWLA